MNCNLCLAGSKYLVIKVIDAVFGLRPDVIQTFVIRVEDVVFGSRPEDTKGDHILVGDGKFYVSQLQGRNSLQRGSARPLIHSRPCVDI
jgi:hypothetical protein